jgi:glutamyl-tRNA reductase
VKILVLGLSHETAPVELRERLAFTADGMKTALGELTKPSGVPEGMILSTCNRVELYAAAPDAESGLAAMREFLCNTHGIGAAELEGRLYAHSGQDALEHIFRVTSSLDSLIVGEPQIVSQVKEAYQAALELGAAGGWLNRVLHKAFSVAKRVRTETGIATHAVSVSYAAVELARKIFGELDGKTVLLVGAGEMGELAAKHLQKNGAAEILVSNRTWEKAVDLSQQFSGTPVPFEKLAGWLHRADIVISAAAAPHHLITRPMVLDARRVRKHKPVFLIDIAVPRTIEPEVNGLDDIYLYGIDDLRGVVDANMAARRREAEKAEKIVDTEAAEFVVTLGKVELGPTIALLNGKLEGVRKAEVARVAAQLASLSPEQREAVERITRGLIAKIAHEPITALKDGSLEPDVLRRVFGLAPIEAVSGGAADEDEAALAPMETPIALKKGS